MMCFCGTLLRLQTKSNIHLMNLAAADALTGTVTFSFTIVLVSFFALLQLRMCCSFDRVIFIDDGRVKWIDQEESNCNISN